MHTHSLRILLAADSGQQATTFEYCLRQAGHEVVAVEARGDTALRAARLIYPDLVVLGGPLRGPLDAVALGAALQAGDVAPVPMLLVANPAELLALLDLQARHGPYRTN